MRILIYIVGGILLFWVILTIITQYIGRADTFEVEENAQALRAALIYNPDPYYNLDEQVCNSFGEGLQEAGIAYAVVPTQNFNTNVEFDLYLFCANTYNWAPDWGIQQLIRQLDLTNKPVAAITVGAGSTQAAKRKLERLLNKQSAQLLGSETYWLLRPNDEHRPDEDNVFVAMDLAKSFGEKIGEQIKPNDLE